MAVQQISQQLNLHLYSNQTIIICSKNQCWLKDTTLAKSLES